LNCSLGLTGFGSIWVNAGGINSHGHSVIVGVRVGKIVVEVAVGDTIPINVHAMSIADNITKKNLFIVISMRACQNNSIPETLTSGVVFP
jgi:hypothetical protein